MTFTVNGTGSYTIVVKETATFAASYATFQYMRNTGLVLQESCILEYLDHCVFTSGTPGGRFLSFFGPGSYTVTNASFPTNPGSSAVGGDPHNVYRAGDEGHVYFLGWSGDFGGPDYEDDQDNRVWWSGSGLPPVENLSISHVSATDQIRLDWVYPFPATSFKIESSLSPDGTFANQGTTSGNTWSQATPGGLYFYRVKAVGP